MESNHCAPEPCCVCLFLLRQQRCETTLCRKSMCDTHTKLAVWAMHQECYAGWHNAGLHVPCFVVKYQMLPYLGRTIQSVPGPFIWWAARHFNWLWDSTQRSIHSNCWFSLRIWHEIIHAWSMSTNLLILLFLCPRQDNNCKHLWTNPTWLGPAQQRRRCCEESKRLFGVRSWRIREKDSGHSWCHSWICACDWWSIWTSQQVIIIRSIQGVCSWERKHVHWVIAFETDISFVGICLSCLTAGEWNLNSSGKLAMTHHAPIN